MRTGPNCPGGELSGNQDVLNCLILRSLPPVSQFEIQNKLKFIYYYQLQQGMIRIAVPPVLEEKVFPLNSKT